MSSNMFVGKYYRMDPQTENVLSSGRELKEGMVVLIESPGLREDVSILTFDEAKNDRLFLNNRWCEIVTISEMNANGTLAFIGLYADGVKRQRRVPIGQAWIVKKDSLPGEPDVVEHENAENTENTENAENAEGTSDLVDYAEADAEATMTTLENTAATDVSTTEETFDFDGDAEGNLDYNQELGPLARAMLVEERTVTEHIKVYAPEQRMFMPRHRRRY